jgi:RNA polymerase sigma-70 factor (ECF subfamily)
MQQQELIPHLFRTEYRKIVVVLGKLFGFAHIEIAEDITSDTFLQASETWGLKGIPENPAAWLYTVAKNKAKDYLKRNDIFSKKIVQHLQQDVVAADEIEIDLSPKNIEDSQLQMMFAICHHSIVAEAQIGLSLRILCGFGINEIADAFLTNKETINKRLFRAKEKLKEEKADIKYVDEKMIEERLPTVITTLYLLFNEGYYSSSKDKTLRKELCFEAMRLVYLLISYEPANHPPVNALMALMCFHASRFEARENEQGEIILYSEQDESKWDTALITQGEYFLNKAATGNVLSKYHLEAGIAFWHTTKEDNKEKWETILQLYNKLLQIEYSPIAALNRTYALAKANGIATAIREAEKLNLTTHHLYHVLLAELYKNIDMAKTKQHLEKALSLARSATEKSFILNKLNSADQ